MKWNSLFLLSIVLLATSSVITFGEELKEIDWKESSLTCEVEKQALIVELKQYKEENNILHQWKKMRDEAEKATLTREARERLENYLKEKAQQAKEE